MDNQFPPGYMSYGQQFKTEQGQQQPASQQQGQQQGQQGQQFKSEPGQQQQQQQQQQQPPQHPPQQQPGLSSFGSLSATPGHSQQDSPASGHPTLPPLQQSQNGGYAQFGSMSYAHPGSQTHTPPTPHTPVTSSMGNGQTSAYSHVSPASAMGPPSYSQNPYGMSSSSMMYPSSTSTSMPPSSTAGGLPTIRPMPPGGVGGPMGSLPSLGGPHLGQQASFMQNEEAPTHVVGSQGRRGILPSAPGRPNAPVSGSGQATKNMIPQKDADGKYPCPHCNKTYLHAKHLKRHLLRHTGDRPYSCHLCKDTFSRSDILKRHFQKCSIRRGNPTGANHLAHQRRNTNTGNRLSISGQEGPIGLAGLSEVAGNNPYNPGVVSSSPTVNGDMSGRSSRANSLIAPNGMSHRNSVAGLGILGSNGPGGEQQVGSTQAYHPNLHAYALQNSSNGGQMPPSYAFNQQHMNGGMYSQQQQQQQQPMSFLGQQSSRFDTSHNSPHQQTSNGETSGPQMDWSRVFNQSGQDGFIGGSLPANASSQGMNNIKAEPDSKPFNDSSNDSFLGSLYSHPGAFGCEDQEGGIPGFPNWSMDDPLQAKVDSLMQYCFPDGGEPAHSDPDAAEMVKMCLSVENVKHFAEHYTSYHGHWPIIHMPSFKLTDAGNPLVLAIITIGAIYSPRMNVTQSRQMMEFVRATVVKKSSIWQRVSSGNPGQDLGTSSWEVDELQALLIISTMFTWHGSPEQRDVACSDLPIQVRIARAMGLLQAAPPGHYAYSVLHHSQGGSLSQQEWSSWNWHGWLEQEKRSRAMYLLFLCDAAMCMYFNNTPQLDPLEIRLPLPSDDAAWDAKDGEECAKALGLKGPEAQSRNITGTRNARQPSMHDATRTLLELNGNFQPGATNVYSKFVLIHALITRIMACQKVLFNPEGAFQGFNNPFGGSGPATPLSQHEWLDQHGNGSLSNGNSGTATPTDGYSAGTPNAQLQHEKKRLNAALDKWKRMWDSDIELQYPPTKTQLRRFGFSRDGVHFFYLGRSFIQSNRPGDWTAPPDVRFKQVMGLLKRIKQFVVGDPSHYGHEIGSVGDIDDQYGLDNLTLDMKLLFKPYNSQVHSAVASVQTSAL